MEHCCVSEQKYETTVVFIFGRARIDLYFIFVCYEYALWYHVMVILIFNIKIN